MIYLISTTFFLLLSIFLHRKLKDSGKPMFQEGDFLTMARGSPKEEWEIPSKDIVITKVGKAKYQYRYYFEWATGNELSSMIRTAPFDTLESLYEKYDG